ncbi:MFS transporter [Anthocerotibacter panamensis]|uniref:MFS transporter n=1 Tax=Anthocerotibacter panamensis TaxID=2857077 RepID=UPI001FDA1287|nr:MFS transporter [Anthocerotibacter panamensis]
MKLQRPSPIVFIFITIFIEFMGGSLLVPILPYIVERYSSDAFTIGLLSASFALAQFVAAPVLGAASDRFGRRPVLLWCVVGTGLGYLIFGLAGALWMLFLGRIIDGITGGVVSTAQAYIADISRAEDRAQNFGLVGAAFGLGFILGPAIGGILAEIDLNLPVFVAAALTLANVALGYVTLTESLPPEKRQVVPLAELNPLTQLANLVRNREVRLLMLGFFLFNFAFAGFQSVFAVFTRDRFAWGTRENAFLFAYIGLISSVVQGGLIRTLIPRYGETKLALTGLTLCALAMAGVAYVPTGGWLYGTQFLFALGVGLCLPTLRALISARATAQEQGRIIGGSQALVSLAMVLGPLWAGFIFDRIGFTAPYWSASFWMFSALGLIALALRRFPAVPVSARPPGSAPATLPK